MTRAFGTLLLMSLKAYYRNRQAIFFSLVFPLLIMVIFGLLNLGGSTSVHVGVVDKAHNQASQRVVDGLKQVSAVKLEQGSEDAEVAALNRGDRDLVAVLPADLGTTVLGRPPGCPASAPCPTVPTIKPTTITAYLNQARPAQAQVAHAILDQYAARASFGAVGLTPPFSVEARPLTGKNETYVDFLVPGVIGLSVMQTGVFSVAFAFVELRERGILRRLMATPMRKLDFMAAQVTTRLLMGVVQVAVLLAVGTIAFHFHLVGNVVEIVVAAAVGSVVFIALGFVISGVSKNEDSVPAISNVIVLPMMFLSGVFFPTDSVPSWLRVISDRLPLTYLNDALRHISLDGASLWTVRWDLVAMAAWLLAMTLLATRAFKWESGA
jgi:ABC-2 type transport system permease protein